MRFPFLVAVGLASAALAQPLSAPTGFLKTTWGMTSAQVIATESAKPNSVRAGKPETVVQYDSIGFAGLTGRVLYVFANDKLVRVKVLFDAEHGNEDEFIGDFRAVEPILLEKYGKASFDRAIWEDDQTQQEPKSYLDQDRATATGIFPSDTNVGLAVSLGHVKLFTERTGGGTRIVHAMTGADHHITHQVEFSRAN
ncbi:MAG TPA: hypothetical protein VG096_20010 [Bryobacteraceae bacterium]|nr:hypothetical protein [Bryobacteraceae bacterium]